MAVSYVDSASTSNQQARQQREVESITKPRNFDPDNKIHRKGLLDWCHKVWEADFRRAMQAGNPPFYHDCCCTFSRRSYEKKAGHPKLQTSQVSKIPTFKDVSTADQFYKWLYKVLASNKKRGDRCLFPKLNTEHYNDDILGELEALETIEELRNKLGQASDLIIQHENTIRGLKDEKEQLLHANKNWFLKYQEVLESAAKIEDPDYQTPMKNNKRSFSVLEEF